VFPTVDQVSAATSIELAELKACYLLVQPEPRPEVYEYAARNRAMFSAEGLHHVSAHGCPGPPRDVLQGLEGEWARGNGCQPPPDDRVPAAWSGRRPGVEEDRLTQMVEDGTYGVGIVLLTKVLCVMKPDRFIALLPYASGNGKGKQDIGRVVFGLTMPSLDSTGLSIGRLAYWSNDLLRDALLALSGPAFIDMEHAKEFLWGAFRHLQAWQSIFDNLPSDPPPKASSAASAT